MTTRLQVYSGALLLCGQGALSTLTDNIEGRHLLDTVWNDGGVRYCLEQAQWHFAMRASEITYNPSIAPPWGFQRAFDKPTDWIVTSGIWSDEYMNNPLVNYADEIGYWFADVETIYVKYVSDDVTYGADLSRWPATFTDFVKAYFAGRICHKLNGGASREFLLGPPGRPDDGWVNRCLQIAKNKAAMTQPATFPSRGTWAQARHSGFHRSARDGGNLNSLIG